MDLGLQGKVALVMAASKGLGRASASALAHEGVSVTIGARDSEKLTQTAQEIGKTSESRVLAVPCDVTHPEDLATIVETTMQEFGRLDILVNNAGGPPFGYFDSFDDEAWQQAFELNLLSTIRLIRLVLPHMRQAGGGRIINIVSTSVKQPIDGLLLSNTIRPGVVGLAKSLSFELAPDNITINNVCPGRILTDRLLQGASVQEKLAQGISAEEALSGQTKDIPLGRLGKPEELGALVAFLASSQASYITGTTIPVDGGLVRSLL
ncbi:oxidoreductase [Reticulibacter mediterranei]|uniref:Oxidoreductase n=1 Tax=Reticulibacter mediterranei TaxID=2778369 RepID=A0A8J3IQH0_9CHLR|nr:SDR family oxidoreductase [Reticulibacter mediterranei]GHO93546.1 oxidoreductase [Reticulibacter mediterranei]